MFYDNIQEDHCFNVKLRILKKFTATEALKNSKTTHHGQAVQHRSIKDSAIFLYLYYVIYNLFRYSLILDLILDGRSFHNKVQ